MFPLKITMTNCGYRQLSGSGDGPVSNSGQNGSCTKEKYWNSTSGQTILGKLHPVVTAV